MSSADSWVHWRILREKLKSLLSLLESSLEFSLSQTVQWRCTVVRPTCKVNGKRRTLNQWHQNPWNFSNLNLTSGRSTPVQIFLSIRSAGASPQVGEILRFCDFFLVSYLVILYFCLGHAPWSNPWMDFHGLWLIRRVIAQGRSFWGLRQCLDSFGDIAPKTPQKGDE